MTCHHVDDDLAEIVAGDRAAIERNADHLASCDDCRDARHDAQQLVGVLAGAGSDHLSPTDLVARILAAVDRDPVRTTSVGMAVAPTQVAMDAVMLPAPEVASPSAPAPVIPMRRRTRMWIAAGVMTAAAASVVGVAVTRSTPPGETGAGTDTTATGDPVTRGPAKLVAIDRAAKDQGSGVSVRQPDNTWTPLAAGATIPAGARIKTDERTRASVTLSDGSRVTLDHRSELDLGATPTLTSGRVVAELVGKGGIVIDGIRVIGADSRFAATIAEPGTGAATNASIQVVRGSVDIAASAGKDTVRAGEEATIANGTIAIAAVPNLAKSVAWSELGTGAPGDDALAGLGSLRAYKPGEARDRDWKLALANHDVKVRIVGPVARTEITETFRNDSATQLEGVYQFPLPPDAKIDGLSLDDPKNGGFIDGAFVDKARAKKIFQGVIEHATPHPVHKPNSDIVWIAGPWKDPALLDWQRGGRFELRIFPIPAHGSRTIKIAYTQVVTPRGPWRQYVYPLPHASNGSAVADSFHVDVEVRGAAQGLVHSAGYDLVVDPARTTVAGRSLSQAAFVPKGDLAIDYRPAEDPELRAWTFAGGSAMAPDDAHAKRRDVGIDKAVVDAQKLVASDSRPTAVLALQPQLPRWRDDKPRDYVIVVDASQSMVGERYTRAGQLAVGMINEMDRRDRVVVMACDSECRAAGDLRAPSAQLATDTTSWLTKHAPAGASDVVESVRAAAKLLTGDRERWVIYVGDGFASTGFRRSGDIEQAIAMTTADAGVHVSTVGIGSDADTNVLSAVSRAGGGSSIAWRPGETISTTAIASLESTYGTQLRDATITLPAGLADVAPTTMSTIRAGEEVLIGARVVGDVSGDVIVKGTVGGQPFEQRYPLKLAVSSAAGNSFVPPLWASLAIEQLERAGHGDDRVREVAMSQAYGVMSRETSLLVLESDAMFNAFGIDRPSSRATWTGESDIEETASTGTIGHGSGTGSGYGMAGGGMGRGALAKKADSAMGDASGPADDNDKAKDDARVETRTTSTPANNVRPPAAPAKTARAEPARDPRPRTMIPMRRVWERVPSVSPYDTVNPAITKAINDADADLAAHPDSREAHRALVQALSYAGQIDRAKTIAAHWLERDKLDPQALGYLADLEGRNGQREEGLRTLSGLVDLDADKLVLHERMIAAYEHVGRLAQACSHRIAIVSIAATSDTKAAAGALRCLRSLGRDRDADIVRKSLRDDAIRSDAERLAMTPAIPAQTTGELVIDGHWTGGADLDISLVTPDGTRVSWMGGRADALVSDATSTSHEALAIKNAKRGNYLVEITRGTSATGSTATSRGTLDITLLGQRRSLPFELTGARTVVGRISVSLVSHLEPVTYMDPD